MNTSKVVNVPKIMTVYKLNDVKVRGGECSQVKKQEILKVVNHPKRKSKDSKGERNPKKTVENH